MRNSVLLPLLVVCACGGETREPSVRPDVADASGGAANADAGVSGAGFGGAGGSSIGGALPFWPDAGAPHDTTEHSGDHVQVVDWTTGDTDLFRKELRDVLHDAPCELRMAADGETRCLPLRQGEILFSDPQCAKQVVLGVSEALPAPYPFCGLTGTDASEFVSVTTTVCDVQVTSLFTRGAEVPAPSATYANGDTGCRPYGNPQGKRAFEPVPSPLTDWVAYRRSVVEITPRLGVEMWTGQDGSVVRGSPHLMQEDATCEPSVDDYRNPFVATCLPTNSITQQYGFFEDGACTQPVLSYKTCAGKPLVAHAVPRPVPGDECGALVEDLVELGDEVAASSISWVFFANPCSPAPPASVEGLAFHRSGAPIPRSRFPLLTARAEKDGAFSRMMWTLDGENIVPLDGVGATGSAQGDQPGSCRRYTLRDGTTLCAPWDTEPPRILFGDPKCETGVLVLNTDACSAERKPTWVADVTLSDYCGDFGMRQVLGVHSGPTYRYVDPVLEPDSTDTCVEITETYPGDTAYDLGPKVPATSTSPPLDAKPL